MTTESLVDPGRVLPLLGLDPSTCTLDNLVHNPTLTPAIWKVTADGRQFVVKALSSRRAEPRSAWDAHWSSRLHEPGHWSYWAREGLAYTNGVVRAFVPGGIDAPDLLASQQEESLLLLLLEFVEGRPASTWSLGDYAGMAAALGRAQGEFLTGRPIPSHPWLSRRFIREYSCEKPVDWSLLDSDAAWNQPLVRDNFPAELREAAKLLHSCSERLCSLMEALPRTLCHLDFWTPNLIWKPDGRIALLDWAFVGEGAIGEDIGNLVPDAAFDHFVPAAALPDLHETALDGYVRGLAQAGWTGDPRLAEVGMCASAVKYDWLTPWMLASASAQTQLRYGGTEEIDAVFRFRERGLALLQNALNAQRALTLAAELGI
ncbi:MAG TPA: phosphotransferase [Actinomycetota bacterium]|nr:phosphotransferase [Actinomycetota bacterium]